MLTTRTFLLTITGLFTSYLASAQSTTPASGPAPTDILSWLAWGLAAVVLIFGVMTATSIAAVAARAAQEELPAPAPAESAAPVAATEQRVAA